MDLGQIQRINLWDEWDRLQKCMEVDSRIGSKSSDLKCLCVTLRR